ncbi:MAG: YiiD C-terminal domain-containing protein [Chthoniobacteraceae bacterium]
MRPIAPREIEQFFHAKIPLTAAMGVQVESYDAQRLILTAPLEENHNHLGTAFGGSLAALLILSGYGLLWLELGDAESHIVVRKTSLDYRRPVRGPLRAICPRPTAENFATFKDTYTRRGKARIELHATIEQRDIVAVEFRGLFVALRS